VIIILLLGYIQKHSLHHLKIMLLEMSLFLTHHL